MSRTFPSESFRRMFKQRGWGLSDEDLWVKHDKLGYRGRKYGGMTRSQADRFFELRGSRWSCWTSDRFYKKTYGISPIRRYTREFISRIHLESDDELFFEYPTYESTKY